MIRIQFDIWNNPSTIYDEVTVNQKYIEKELVGYEDSYGNYWRLDFNINNPFGVYVMDANFDWDDRENIVAKLNHEDNKYYVKKMLICGCDWDVTAVTDFTAAFANCTTAFVDCTNAFAKISNWYITKEEII